jgi:hypothetical protein
MEILDRNHLSEEGVENGTMINHHLLNSINISYINININNIISMFRATLRVALSAKRSST